MFLSFYLGSSFVENDLNIEDFAKLLKTGKKGGEKAEQAGRVKSYIRPHGGSTTEQQQKAEFLGFPSTAPHFGDIQSDTSKC